MNDDKTEEVTFEQRVFEEFSNLNSRLSALETKVDERLRETRPIWEGVVTDVADIRKEQKLTNHKLDRVILDLANVRAEVQEVDRRIAQIDYNTPTERVK